MITEEQGQQLVEAVKQYLNTPHRNGGHNKGVGVDCALLPACAGVDLGWYPSIEAMGIELFYNAEWYLHSNNEKMLRTVEKFCDKADDLTIQAGDILLYRYGRAISHLVVYVSENLGIHADAYLGYVAYVNLDEPRLAKRYVGRYRIREVK